MMPLDNNPLLYILHDNLLHTNFFFHIVVRLHIKLSNCAESKTA